MEPQGEQADFELRHWDGSDEDDTSEGGKWLDLLDLYGDIEDEVKWSYLRHPGMRLIKGDGEETAETARVMIVGEAPGAVDNGNGRPFSGGTGELLDQCLEQAGLKRSQCFVTNVLKYRTRDGRPPGVGESLMAKDALRAEWGIINPLLTIAIGATAHYLLNPSMVALANFPQGEIWTFAGRSDLYVTSMFNPTMGLRYPRYRTMIEESWDLLGRMIDDLQIRKDLG